MQTAIAVVAAAAAISKSVASATGDGATIFDLQHQQLIWLVTLLLTLLMMSLTICAAARKLHLLLAAHPALRLYRGETGPPAVVRQEEVAVGMALKGAFRQVSSSSTSKGGGDLAVTASCLQPCFYLQGLHD
jgi:hypothetical protein